MGWVSMVVLLLSALAGAGALDCYNCNWHADTSGATISGNSICKDPEALAANGTFAISDMGQQGPCVTCVKEMLSDEHDDLVGVLRYCHPEAIVDVDLGKLYPDCYDREYYLGIEQICYCDAENLCNSAHGLYILPITTLFLGSLTLIGLH